MTWPGPTEQTRQVIARRRRHDEASETKQDASVPHADLGTTTIEGSRFRLSRTPARLPESAPTYGRDTAWVLAELLGYDEARITELVASGALD